MIELVVVILILGILAATALPKFIDVTDEARDAAFSGTSGGLSTGIALAHAQWMANGASTTAGLVAGYGTPVGDVYANTAGWPIDDSSATTSCIGIWNGIFQGGAPSLAVAANTAAAVTAGVDYYIISDSAATCVYTYTAVPAKTISYALATGAVAVAN